MPKNYLFVLYIVFFSAAAVACAFFASGLLAFGLAGFICILIGMLSFVLRSPNYGATKLRMLCLLLVASRGGLSTTVNSVAGSLVNSQHLAWLPTWVKDILIGAGPSTTELVFWFGLLVVVFYFTRDRSGAANQPASAKDDFPEEDFKQRRESFCSKLRHDLITLDKQSKWDPDNYADLEAEVEVRSSHGAPRQKKTLNLQKAIQVDEHLSSFLLLGVPGAGKSVALRKLALRMLDKMSANSRIPIYVNLREWTPKRVVENGRVTFQFDDLQAFVTASITKGESTRQAFVNEYFLRLWSAGQLFFIFDSFDEISELLDAGKDEEVVDALSVLISRFISGDGKSKGILASRFFRRPTDSFQALKELEIRPLSEAAAMQGLSRFSSLSRANRLALLRERRDLAPLVRNPFMLALLGDWLRTHTDLPENQAHIYESFIAKRLECREDQLAKAGIGKDEFISLTTKIAWYVFSVSSYGLEAPVAAINTHFRSAKVGVVLNTLRAVGIARVTEGSEQSFAFVHRRFLEYFVTRRLLDDPKRAPIADIPTDSRGRDALVLYAQICELDEAQRIARLCWDEISANFDVEAQRMRAIHCLRFLVDAFCFRREAIQGFGYELHQFVERHVGTGDNLVFAKICLEATGLLPEMKTAPMLSLALSGGDDWLQETAFKACRYLPRVDERLERDIAAYLSSMPDLRFWQAHKGLLLSLSLSEALKSVYLRAQLRVGNLMASFAAAVLLLFVAPKAAAAGGIYAVFVALAPQRWFEKAPKSSEHNPELASDQKAGKPLGVDWATAGSLERALIMFRYMTVGALVLFCLMGLVGLLPVPEQDIGWVLYQASCLGLALMLLDWMATLSGLRNLLPKLLEVKFWLTSVGAVLTCAGLVGGMVWVARKSEGYGSHIDNFLGILMTLMVGFLIVLAVRGWWPEYWDRRQVNGMKVTRTVNRLEIVRVLNELRTNKGRSRYVQHLGQYRVKAVGLWPDGFTLAVGQGQHITELARLEERWLCLDR